MGRILTDETFDTIRSMAKRVHSPSAEDIAEVKSGKGTARDRAEVTAYASKTRKALRKGRGGMTKRRSVKRSRTK